MAIEFRARWTSRDGSDLRLSEALSSRKAAEVIAEALRRNPDVDHVKAIAVEPVSSPVITPKMAGQPVTPVPHLVQGLGAGFILGVRNTRLVDEVIQLKDNDAFEASRRLAREEGMLCAISCGVAAGAAI
jgi:cysteine synthase A